MSTEVERAQPDCEVIAADRIHWNLSPAAFTRKPSARQEAMIAAEGPLACLTGQHTRPLAQRQVRRSRTVERGRHRLGQDQPSDGCRRSSTLLHADLLASMAARQGLFVLDCYAGADPAFRLPIRVVNELRVAQPVLPGTCSSAIRSPSVAADPSPQFTVIDSPSFKADPKRHGTNSEDGDRAELREAAGPHRRVAATPAR